MAPLLDIAQSGLTAESLRLEVGSNNVANSLTSGFVPSGVAAEALPLGGVAGRVVPGDPAVESQLDRTVVGMSAPSGTDLARETANRISASAAFRANLQSLRAAEVTDRALFSLRS